MNDVHYDLTFCTDGQIPRHGTGLQKFSLLTDLYMFGPVTLSRADDAVFFAVFFAVSGADWYQQGATKFKRFPKVLT